MKKTTVAAAILMAVAGTAQANTVWNMTGGSFDFYDASGNYVTDSSHTNVNGTFNLATQEGSFSSTTPFNGEQWSTSFTGMYFGPTDGTTADYRFDWTTKTYEDTFSGDRSTCNASGLASSCTEYEVTNPTWYDYIGESNTATDTTRSGALDTSTGYEFTLGAGQMAAGVFFDWSVNLGIPVLAVMQITGQGIDANGNLYMDIVSVDADGDGLPGVQMQTAPFPGQTPAFGGRLICEVVNEGDCTPPPPAAVPVPAAVWLFGSGLVGLAGIARRRKTA